MFRPKLFTLLKNKPEEFTTRNILKEIMVGLIISFISIPLSIYNFINDIGRENICLNLNSALKQADKYIKSLLQK